MMTNLRLLEFSEPNLRLTTTNWKQSDEQLIKFISSMPILDEDLSDVDYVTIRTKLDVQLIPDEIGIYFLSTNEPITHSFGVKECSTFDGFKGVYCGHGSLRKRSIDHLLKPDDASIHSDSGISVDLYCGNLNGYSHNKHAYGKRISANGTENNAKLPKFNGRYVSMPSDLLKLGNISDDEHQLITNCQDRETIIFRNGIDVTSAKQS